MEPNTALERVLKHLADQGLTLDLLAHTSDEDLASLPGPDGPLTRIQIVLIRAAINKAATPRTGTTITKQKLEAAEQEIKALKEAARPTFTAREDYDRLRVAAGRRKQRVSEIMSSVLRTVTVSAQEVRQMIGRLVSIGNNLDICFCMDATGSMGGCINSVKQCIVAVARNIISTTGMTARFALVAYRDYCDGALRHQVFQFGDSTALSSNLGTLSATGGGDGPEDCFGGLWAAISRISWAAPARVIVWMGDAPQHGTQYSGGKGDSLPDGDPDGITAAMIFSELQKKHITLVFCKLKEYTNTMTAQLKVDVVPFGSELFLESNFGGEMTSFLTATLHRTTSLTAGHGGGHHHHHGKEKPFILTPAAWTLNTLWGPEELGEIISFEAYNGGDLHPLLDILADGPGAKTRSTTVRMTLNPVEKGEMRFAFYAKIIEGSGWVWQKKEKKGMTKVSRYEGSHNSRKALMDQAHIQAVATFLGKEFTLKLAKLGKTKKVVYVPVELLRIPGRTSGDTIFSLEPFIDGNYVKFNNNNGFVDKALEASHPLMQTFSHFTYSYSQGLVMVTDVQGVVKDAATYMLTDPAIHTADSKTCLADQTNLGREGMGTFFLTHVCNNFCRLMLLKRPEDLDVSAPIEPQLGIPDDQSSEADREDAYTSFN